MSGRLTYTILVDNSAHAEGMETEHGLSILIHDGSTRVLFDTGESPMLLRNAGRLGCDLSAVDHLVLSHGHDDHTGGLPALSQVLPLSVPIYAHPGILSERYSRHADGSIEMIGIPESARQVLAARPRAFHPVTQPTEIASGVWVTGPVPRLTAFEDKGGDFWLDRACTVPDLIDDDLALWLVREEGLWIFLGCAHAGTVNTIQYIRSVSGCRRVAAVIGGTHLRNASPERLSATMAFLQELSPSLLLPCHCSGGRIPSILPS